jgi:hypothetical protein
VVVDFPDEQHTGWGEQPLHNPRPADPAALGRTSQEARIEDVAVGGEPSGRVSLSDGVAIRFDRLANPQNAILHATENVIDRIPTRTIFGRPVRQRA